jgi:predicted dehydrogenase
VAIRCGIIGYGTIGRLLGGIMSSGSSGFQLAAVADPAFSVTDCTTYLDYRDLLALDLDCVAIATPPATHFEVAMEALRAGKDVFLEKPPCETPGEARQLARAADDCGRVLFFAWHARYNPAVIAAKKYLRGREISSIHVVFKENVHHFHRQGSWVFKEGVIRDSGVNAFSIVSELIDERVRITAVSGRVQPGTGYAAIAQANLRYDGGGIPVTFEMNWTSTDAEIRSFEIESDKGHCRIDLTRGVFSVDGSLPDIAAPGSNMMRVEYELMLRDWVDCIQRRQNSCGMREMEMLSEGLTVSGTLP